jgi:ankyrin repeat protein
MISIKKRYLPLIATFLSLLCCTLCACIGSGGKTPRKEGSPQEEGPGGKAPKKDGTPQKETPEEPKSQLLDALIKDKPDLVTTLAQKGVDLNADLKDIGMPPLHCIVARAKTSLYGPECQYSKTMLQALIDNGADINKKIISTDYTYEGDTPLTYMIFRGDKDTFEDLLKLGANPNAFGFKEKAPLHYAIIKYYKETNGNLLSMIKALLNTPKIELRLKDGKGHEPLYYAYHRENGKPFDPDDIEEMKPIIDLFKHKGISYPKE